MKFSNKINTAITRATLLHFDQKRKGDGFPYIIHPYAVAYIVSRYTDNEDTIIAAFLHDVLEDVKKEKYSKEEMIKEFGKNVFEIVKGVSEDKDATITKEEEKKTWMERKEKYIENLKHDSEASLIIACADKIHNIICLCEAYKKDGDKVLKNFNAPKDKKKNMFEYNKKVLDFMIKNLHNPIVDELKIRVKELEQIFFKKITYPRYLNVDDVPIIIKLDGEDIVGKCGNGMPYPIGKAYVTGYEITKKEYIKLAKDLYGENYNVEI